MTILYARIVIELCIYFFSLIVGHSHIVYPLCVCVVAEHADETVYSIQYTVLLILVYRYRNTVLCTVHSILLFYYFIVVILKEFTFCEKVKGWEVRKELWRNAP